MPQLKPQQAQKQAYGVNQVQNDLTFQERLMQRFAPHEWVTVINVDDEPFIWQYLPAHEEEHEYTTDPMQITRRGAPEVWQLNPGEMETIVGASAYIMIEQLYKVVVAKHRTIEQPEAPILGRNFNFSDAQQQEFWIKQILIGKAQPKFGEAVESDLGIREKHPKLTKPAGVGASATRTR